MFPFHPRIGPPIGVYLAGLSVTISESLLLFPILPTCPVHFNSLIFLTYVTWTVQSMEFPSPLPSLSLLDPNITVRILFSITLKLPFWLKNEYLLSQPYDKQVILYYITFEFLERSKERKFFFPKYNINRNFLLEFTSYFLMNRSLFSE